MERWLIELEADGPERAWDVFLDRYRRLLFATIRHYVRDADDVMDAFTWVCEGLRADGFRRLRSYGSEVPARARFTTWLVAVVRNLTVDWLRRRNGRRRPTSPLPLSELQRRIHDLVITRREPHVQAYETIRSRWAPDLSFADFLREVAMVHRRVGEAPHPSDAALWEAARADPPEGPVERQTAAILEDVLETLPPTDRVALRMYVIDEVPAAEVARALGLPNPKAVYNRVYRSLATVRAHLERLGLDRDAL